MIKTAPKKGQIALIGVFAAACIFLLLYLWITFGGSTPLAAQGYRIKVAFAQANELATGADVRVAGVNVGKVVALTPDLHDNRTLATLQIDARYVPIPRDARATLRIKTLLGETYAADRSPTAAVWPTGGSPRRSRSTRSSRPSIRRRGRRSAPGCRPSRVRSPAVAPTSTTRSPRCPGS
jgi:hypothetical protein